MKRLFFGLIVAAVALGGSAFTNITTKRHFASFYYILSSTSTYVLTGTAPDPARCFNTAPTACYITYTTTQGSSFPASAIPSGGTVSSTKGLYQ